MVNASSDRRAMSCPVVRAGLRPLVCSGSPRGVLDRWGSSRSAATPRRGRPRRADLSLDSFLRWLLRRPVFGLAACPLVRRRRLVGREAPSPSLSPGSLPARRTLRASAAVSSFDASQLLPFHVALRFRRAARHVVKAAHSRINRGNCIQASREGRSSRLGSTRGHSVRALPGLPLCTFSEVEKRMRRLVARAFLTAFAER